MRVTICQLPNEPTELESSWNGLVDHVKRHESELVLLPEMPFHGWLAHTNRVDLDRWHHAIEAHDRWARRLAELSPATVVSTRPAGSDGTRQNVGYVWGPSIGRQDVHSKYYLPDEPGFWEATWYERGDGDFSAFEARGAKIGMLICTELWFNVRAREYLKQGVDILVCPRATPNPSAGKWVAGGRVAAVTSGAFCLSSNLSGTTAEGCDFAGVGWIIEPEEGEVLGLTSPQEPFLTIDVDLAKAKRAKTSYPRYIPD